MRREALLLILIVLVFPLLLALLMWLAGGIGVDMRVVGYVFLGVGMFGIMTSAVLLVQGRLEGTFILISSVILGVAGGLALPV
jgi:hypothetical protein